MSQTAADTPKPVPANQNEATRLLAYIRDMLREMHKLTPEVAGPMLPYLIDMAHLEASRVHERLDYCEF